MGLLTRGVRPSPPFRFRRRISEKTGRVSRSNSTPSSTGSSTPPWPKCSSRYPTTSGDWAFKRRARAILCGDVWFLWFRITVYGTFGKRWLHLASPRFRRRHKGCRCTSAIAWQLPFYTNCQSFRRNRRRDGTAMGQWAECYMVFPLPWAPEASWLRTCQWLHMLKETYILGLTPLLPLILSFQPKRSKDQKAIPCGFE